MVLTFSTAAFAAALSCSIIFATDSVVSGAELRVAKTVMGGGSLSSSFGPSQN